ncbi:hypothetical protein GCM10008018_61780 [Paenibacillus marchantiophytorum]|uniref:Copper amine oxidase N-terminal domain-containing protein n=1 Tax=Paenibacillus marchantiophytorum TaxID=1619310 RepID=A0ABQ1FF05_9BACL|nr:hypothetical protein GCM10008018_61780 [Paenibacillus marchantiophytorum]
MKKFLIGFIVRGALATTSAVFASDIIQVYLFPVKFVYNGTKIPVNTEKYPILNHNGHAYVPVRFVGETIGKIVKY